MMRCPPLRGPGRLALGLVALLLPLASAQAQAPPPAAAPPAAPLLQPAPPPALEPPPAGSETEPDLLVARSVALFNQERYGEAAQAMEDAYVLRPRPLYLFNAAQAHRRAGRPREARSAYQRFLAVAGDAPQVSEATGHLRNMNQLIAAEERAARETANRRALAVTAARSQAELLQAQLRASDDRRRARRRAGLIAGTIGAVALGLAVALPLLLTREPATDWGFHMVTF